MHDGLAGDLSELSLDYYTLFDSMLILRLGAIPQVKIVDSREQ